MANVAMLKKELESLINQQRLTRSNKNTSKSNSLMEQIKKKQKEIANAKQLQKAVGEIARKNGEEMKENTVESMQPLNRNIRQGEINAAAINSAKNAAAASSTPQRHFLFHVTYDSTAANDKKYTAEDVSNDNSKLMEVYGMIDNLTDSKKHFIIHVAYDADTKQYTPTDKSKDPKFAGDIFAQINPANVKPTATNRPLANLSGETIRELEETYPHLASSSGETPAPNSPTEELLPVVSDVLSTNTQGTLTQKIEVARKKLQNAQTAQLNKNGNAAAKAKAVNNAQREMKVAENALAAFNRNKPKNAFSMGGTRRRKQKKAKTHRKRR